MKYVMKADIPIVKRTSNGLRKPSRCENLSNRKYIDSSEKNAVSSTCTLQAHPFDSHENQECQHRNNPLP